MRVLSVSAQKPHATGSGVYLTSLVRAMAEMGCTQAVAAGIYPGEQAVLPRSTEFFPVYFNTPELPFPMPGMSDEMPYQSTVYSAMTQDMVEKFLAAFLRCIRRAVDEFRPDIILCHHLYLLTAAIRREFPHERVFGICHGTDLRQLGKNPLCKDMILGLIPKLDGIFCLHDGQRRAIADAFAMDVNSIHVIGSGYDSSVFRPLPTEPHTGYRLAFAGKISEKKGVFSLIRALGRLPFPPDALTLSLAGGYANSDYPQALELIKTCPYRVELLGALPQESLAGLFNGSDLFILPSFYEGLPLVLAEAMACGTRVICTDLPGIRPFMDSRLPSHGIRFVPPPPMLDQDTPDPSGLPVFEQALADAISLELAQPQKPAPDLSGLSWNAVARSILDRAR